MNRRYGRVTVEGWLHETPDGVYVYDSENGEIESSQVGWIPETTKPTVEYLPAPVTFTDGDVIQFVETTLRPTCYQRTEGARWLPAALNHGFLTDKNVRTLLNNGTVVRLVPEVTG